MKFWGPESGTTKCALGALTFTGVCAAMLGDLGLNLFAEGVGVAFTVFILDRLYAEREKRRLKPLLLAIERDAATIVGLSVNVLSQVLKATVPAWAVSSLRTTTRLSDPRFAAYWTQLDFSREAPSVISFKPLIWVRWVDHAPNQAKNIAQRIDQFIERYNLVAPPDLLAAIHAFRAQIAFDTFPFAAVGPMPGLGAMFEPWLPLLEEVEKKLNEFRKSLGLPEKEEVLIGSEAYDDIERCPFHSVDHPWRQPVDDA